MIRKCPLFVLAADTGSRYADFGKEARQLYSPAYQQNDDEQQYRIVKESLKTAMNMFERLRPDQQQRLLKELMREKAMEGIWHQMQMYYPR